jgi:hypothetical protein
MRRMFQRAAILATAAPAISQTADSEKELTALAKEADFAFTRSDTAFFDRDQRDRGPVRFSGE